ncbi:MAG: hypothetical protein KGQ41_02395 [Alphaproteobacteria bacterium]|nr:hypothetical protein [Alphaproteobacteria bacterium]
MPRIVRNKDLVQIFAKTVIGTEDLIFSSHIRPNGKAPSLRGLKLYDFGGITYTTKYSIGLAPGRRHRLAESAASIRDTFKMAGMPAPMVLPPRFLARFLVPALHRINRFARNHGGWRHTTQPSAQSIR